MPNYVPVIRTYNIWGGRGACVMSYRPQCDLSNLKLIVVHVFMSILYLAYLIGSSKLAQCDAQMAAFAVAKRRNRCKDTFAPVKTVHANIVDHLHIHFF